MDTIPVASGIERHTEFKFEGTIRPVTVPEVATFVAVAEDWNPIHKDPIQARQWCERLGGDLPREGSVIVPGLCTLMSMQNLLLARYGENAGIGHIDIKYRQPLFSGECVDVVFEIPVTRVRRGVEFYVIRADLFVSRRVGKKTRIASAQATLLRPAA